MPVYVIRREMPIGEFWDWLTFFNMQAKRRNEPPGVAEVGGPAMAAALGVSIDGS